VIENLPETNVALILEELLKNYAGVDRVESIERQQAIISFNSADNAKFAVIGLNRYKVD